MSSYWFITYLLTLLLFDLSPGVSFVTVVKNTLQNKSLSIGLFTALGVATSDGLSAIIGFFFCSLLIKHDAIFKYIQIIGMLYLLYVGSKMLFSKAKNLTLDIAKLSTKKQDAYISGFLYTFSNFSIAVVITSVISQFYQYVNQWYGYVLLLVIVPCVSFMTFFFIAFGCYFFKLWKVFGKYSWLIDKIAGFVLIFLALLNLKSIFNL